MGCSLVRRNLRRRSAVLAVVSAAVLIQAGAADAWNGTIVDSPAQLIVGNPAALTSGDQLLQAELEDFGYLVTPVDDAAPALLPSATALVVIAPSINSTTLGEKYKDAATPVVAFATTAWENMAVADVGGSFYQSQNLLVIDSTHPIAAGLPSPFQATNAMQYMRSTNEAALPSGAQPVAVRQASTSAHVVYTVPAGGIRTDGTPAPANRAVIGLSEPALHDLTADGLTLVDNTIYWADTTSATYAVQSQAATALVQQGRWLLDDATSTTTVRDSVNGHNGSLSGDTRVQRRQQPVASSGNYSFYFPGWSLGSSIDADNSAVIVPNFTGFNPGTKNFRIEVWVRPDDSTNAAVLAATDSPNVIQKGLGNEQQWKIALKKDLTPVCVFRGDTVSGAGVSVQTREARLSSRLTPGTRSRLRCELTSGRTALKVYDLNGRLVDSATSAESGGYFSVTPPGDVWFGKKPNDPSPQDAYAGTLDNVVIARAS